MLRALSQKVYGEIAKHTIARGFPREFGLLETAAYIRLGTFEWLERHRRLINELERIRRYRGMSRFRVLDFGGAGGSLAACLRFYGLTEKYRVVLADVNHAAVQATTIRAPLVEKYCLGLDAKLPMPDGDVDVAVSSDVFEHIPRDARPGWAGELKRVSRFGQVHTMPCDGENGRWDSTRCDRELDAWFKRRFGGPEPFTAEHITNGLPSLNEIRELFRPDRIDAFANTDVWTRMLHEQFGGGSAWHRARFSLEFWTHLKEMNSRPPFKACLVVAEL